MDSDEIKKELTKDRTSKPYSKSDLLSTSSTLLNLALTGYAEGGFIKGKYFFFAGDSSSGKTFLALSILAEASINPSFDNYRLIHDDVEGGALMDLKRFFGEKVVRRLEPPKGTKENPSYSQDVDEFYFNLDDVFKEGEPFIYVLDSQDALDSAYSEKKFQELKKSMKKGVEAAGSYGDSKAKTHSTRLRKVCSRLRDTGSILLITNQTRDNVGGSMFSPQSIYSGGRALRFYATAQIWSTVKSRLKKTVKGKDRQIGIVSKVSVKKNRLTGKEWSADVPIYFSYGVDDTGSMVDYLLSEGHWKKKGGIITQKDFDGISGYRDEVVKEIEQQELQSELRSITEDVWKNIEAQCVLDRKPRYE